MHATKNLHDLVSTTLQGSADFTTAAIKMEMNK
jgi:hypothetical protein